MSFQAFPSAAVFSPATSFPTTGFLGQLECELSNGCIDPVIIRSVLRAKATALTQGVANSGWKSGVTTPIGSNELLVAPPTSGKSHLERVTDGPIEEALEEVCAEVDGDIKPDLYLGDTTTEAIVDAILSWPHRLLVSDEASNQDRHLSSGVGKARLTKYIDCHPYQHARVGTGRKALRNYRFKMFLAIQPDELDARKSLYGIGKSGNGFINRFHVAKGGWPVTADMAMQVGLSVETKNLLKKKSIELLQLAHKNVGLNDLDWRAIPFLPDADKSFHEWGREVWSLSQKGQPYHHIAEFVGRSPERIRRWVTTHHLIDFGTEGGVSREYLEYAIFDDHQSIKAFSQMAYSPHLLTQIEKDAIPLEEAIRRYMYAMGEPPKLKELKKYAPNYGLTAARLSRALALLGERGRIQVVTHQGTDLVVLNIRQLSRF